MVCGWVGEEWEVKPQTKSLGWSEGWVGGWVGGWAGGIGLALL
jgi:hypothetical protein